jgi:hypothetical protein
MKGCTVRLSALTRRAASPLFPVVSARFRKCAEGGGREEELHAGRRVDMIIERIISAIDWCGCHLSPINIHARRCLCRALEEMPHCGALPLGLIGITCAI